VNIWLIKEGEPLPCDDNPRLMRTGLLAEYLAEKGHNVVWWASTYSHGQKMYRYNKETKLSYMKNYIQILLHSTYGYKKNISLKRLLYSNQLAKNLKKSAANLEKPDIIICSYPTISFAKAAVELGKQYDIPVILDIRDLWPDIFVRGFPKAIRFIAPVLLMPIQLTAKKTIMSSNGLVGIIPSHLDWALNKANRPINKNDAVIYIGYKQENYSSTEINEELCKWQQLGIDNETWNICFFGTMSGLTMDLETVIMGFNLLVKKYPEMRLVLCGKGDSLDSYKLLAKGTPQIVFPGWVNKKQIISLMNISKLGLYPFHNLPDFRNSLTNKMVEYMSGKLPVLSSLVGFSKNYIENNNIGLIYDEKNENSFASTVEHLYRNEDDRLEKGKNAFNCYSKDFEYSVINTKYENYIAHVVSNYNKSINK